MHPPTSFKGLCHLCEHYVTVFIRDDCLMPDSLPDFEKRWYRQSDPSLPLDPFDGVGFRHHDSYDTLRTSAKVCHLCRLILEDHAAEDDQSCAGELWLVPYTQPVCGGGTTMSTMWKCRFVAAFAKQLDGWWANGKNVSVTDGPQGPERWHLNHIDSDHATWPLKHAFRFNQDVVSCGLREYQWKHYGRKGKVVSPKAVVEDYDFTYISALLEDCVQDHQACQQTRDSCRLPTRVIDVGSRDTQLRLHLSNGESSKYMALTHCWGGEVPFRLTSSNINSRLEGFSLDDLPKTFREAVIIARHLSIRFVWIDALCIIQDSLEDWEREASRMASVYAMSTITLSPLNSTNSEAGVFNFQPVPEITLQDGWTISKLHRNFDDDVADSPLDGRGWCLQERMLSPAILHAGREQFFFECLDGVVGEDGSTSYWAHQLSSQRYGPPSEKAEISRMRISAQCPFYRTSREDMAHWNSIIYEYSCRSITVAADKLPAVAALAQGYQKKSGWTYLSGLWEEDLVRGVSWGPDFPRIDMSSRFNPYVADDRRVTVLKKPHNRTLPSWTWASVDGSVLHKCMGSFTYEMKPESIVDRSLGNNFMASAVSIPLRLNTRTAEMYYSLPRGRHDVGVASLLQGGDITLDGCVMDVDRSVAQPCTVAIVGRDDQDFGNKCNLVVLLLRKEKEADTYTRLGIGTPQLALDAVDATLSCFSKHTFNLI